VQGRDAVRGTARADDPDFFEDREDLLGRPPLFNHALRLGEGRFELAVFLPEGGGVVPLDGVEDAPRVIAADPEMLHAGDVLCFLCGVDLCGFHGSHLRPG
jgi:hypothetical protein